MGAAAAALAPAAALAVTTTPASPGFFKANDPVAGSPVFVSFTNTFNPDLSTTVFQVQASSPDGSPLSYAWKLSAPCGSITAPSADQPTNGYYHGPTPQNPDGCPPPPGNEIQTTIEVTVFKTADKDSTGGPKPGSSYFTYIQAARAQDEDATSGYPTNAQLDYFGIAAVATPTPTTTPAPPTTAPTAQPTSLATTTVSSAGVPTGLVVLIVIVLVIVIAIAIWTYLHTGHTVERPPVEKCAKEKADLARAQEAARAAHAKLDPLKALADKLRAAQLKQSEAQQASDEAQKRAGAEQREGSVTENGVTTTKSYWHYKRPSFKKDAEAARAALESANAAVATAQKAFDGAGGWDAYYQALRDAEQADAAVKTCSAALDHCLGLAGTPGEATTGGTTTGGGGGGQTVDGGVKVAVPPVVEKPKNPCEGKPDKTVVVVSGTFFENQLSWMKIVHTGGYDEGAKNARDMISVLMAVNDAYSIGESIGTKALENPGGFFDGGFPDPVNLVHDLAVDKLKDMAVTKVKTKLPDMGPGGYRDMMAGALDKGLNNLIDGLTNSANIRSHIGDYEVDWPRRQYRYTGTVVCTCVNGYYMVKSRDLKVDPEGKAEVVRKPLNPAEQWSDEDLQREVQRKTQPAINENVQEMKKLEAAIQALNEAGCG